jgi:lipoyl(octanoyl) transferase
LDQAEREQEETDGRDEIAGAPQELVVAELGSGDGGALATFARGRKQLGGIARLGGRRRVDDVLVLRALHATDEDVGGPDAQQKDARDDEPVAHKPVNGAHGARILAAGALAVNPPPCDTLGGMVLRWVFVPRLSYDVGASLQARLVAARLTGPPDCALATEHEPVVTLGLRAGAADLLLSADDLARRGIALRRAPRGGLATYHGPGQLVLYPIVDLRGLGVRRFVALLEEAAVAVAAAAGVRAMRRPGHPGAWVGEAKVASIGIRVVHGVSSHGLAVNLAGDCTPFTWIRPCGMTAGSVASLEAVGGRRLDVAAAARVAVARLAAGLGARPEEIAHASLEGFCDG